MDYIVSRPAEYREKFYYAYRRSIDYALHIHRQIEIIVVTDGVLRMQIGNTVRDIPKGCAAIAKSFEPHSFIGDKENTALIIEFSPEQLEFFSDWVGQRNLLSSYVRLDDEVTHLLRLLLPEKGSGRVDLSGPRVLAILAPLCYSVMEHGEWSAAEGRCDDLFIKALTFISDNFDKPISRETVASVLGVRPETVSRIFKRHSSTSFSDYVRRIQIYKATRMLDRGVSVTEAALSSGFDSIRTFNRVFKAVVGKTPTEYLKQC